MCDIGYHGIDCEQQASAALCFAVILSVGTLLVLFIAWGFRCHDEGEVTDMDGMEQRRSGRQSLLREGTDRAAAAARPPTVRGTETPSSAEVSCTGVGTDTSGERAAASVLRVHVQAVAGGAHTVRPRVLVPALLRQARHECVEDALAWRMARKPGMKMRVRCPVQLSRLP